MQKAISVSVTTLAILLAGCGGDDGTVNPPPITTVPPPAPTPAPPPPPTTPAPAPEPVFSTYQDVRAGNRPFNVAGFGITERVIRDATGAVVRTELDEDVPVNVTYDGVETARFTLLYNGATISRAGIEPGGFYRYTLTDPPGLLQFQIDDFPFERWVKIGAWIDNGSVARAFVYGDPTKPNEVIRTGFRIYNFVWNAVTNLPTTLNRLPRSEAQMTLNMQTGQVRGSFDKDVPLGTPGNFAVSGTVTDFSQPFTLVIRNPAGAQIGSVRARLYGPDAQQIGGTFRLTADQREQGGHFFGRSSQRFATDPNPS